ncbi:MAG: AI-2E family transporter [Gemmatimonadaceae bacterium]|nr:AI-2E family transporter [Gemmatimonadaceae bacterium]
MSAAPRVRELTPQLRVALLAAAFMVVVAGLRAAAPVLTPLALAAFVAAVSLPSLGWLRSHGVRTWLAILTIVLLDAAILSLFAWIVVETVIDLSLALPAYIERGQEIEGAARARLARWGMELPAEFYATLVQPQRLLEIAASWARNVTSWISVLFLMLLYLVFILVESVSLPAKVAHVLGRKSRALVIGETVLRQVQRYLVVKTLISLLTGATIGISAALLGVDFAAFWGLLAFALNYIPTIGSIVAALPAVAVASLQLGVERGLALAGVYLAANIALGSVADPILIGRQLRLSPIVILVSLVFWGWTWGLAGAFLAVPLTITLRVGLQSAGRLSKLAALMGPLDPSVVAPPNATLPGDLAAGARPESLSEVPR